MIKKNFHLMTQLFAAGFMLYPMLQFAQRQINPEEFIGEIMECIIFTMVYAIVLTLIQIFLDRRGR